jgi:hypothetical protein
MIIATLAMLRSVDPTCGSMSRLGRTVVPVIKHTDHCTLLCLPVGHHYYVSNAIRALALLTLDRVSSSVKSHSPKKAVQDQEVEKVRLMLISG